ncbi:MAG: hypothetical protein M3418_04565 [Gemmatimonadota bacterium]|nr:hypothetical protein [Gemmatimonadota bacterium]
MEARPVFDVWYLGFVSSDGSVGAISSDRKDTYARADQEACTCDDRVIRIDYDPYGDSGGDDCGGSGGGGGGSGTQYYPGDYTGGETVNWGTGTGNGGTSACGSSALVEYVCIDVWDGEKWVEWSCGYATTC